MNQDNLILDENFIEKIVDPKNIQPSLKSSNEESNFEKT
jgi:hypothetical protein